MHILYLHQYFATPDSNAGTRSYEIGRRLVMKGHQVTFITSSAYMSGEENLTSGWNLIEIEGMKLHVLHLPYSNTDPFWKRIITFLRFSLSSSVKALSIKADVVFATSTPLTIAIPATLYSKIKRKPMVFEVRDLWPELPIAVGALKNRVAIYLARWLEKQAYRHATKIIGLSPGMCEGIVQVDGDRKKVVQATNSCDTELFDVSSDIGVSYKFEKMPFLQGRKLVVYTGTFGVINNVAYLVDLAQAMKSIDPDICFLAVGEGMEKTAIRQYAQKLGVLEQNLYLWPGCPKTEIVKILASADMALSLFGPVKAMWHNSANKLFDALASGTPVAINYGGWQAKLIEETKCGICLDRKDIQSSAQQISVFLASINNVVYAKSQCRTLAYGQFSRDRIATSVEVALREACGDKT